MAVTDNKMAVNAATAKKKIVLSLAPAASLTDEVVRIVQFPHPVVIERFAAFCRAVAGGAVTVEPYLLAPGKPVQAITIDKGTTHTKYQTTAFDAILPVRTAVGAGGVPLLKHKAAADEQVFSSIFTINAAASGTVWGAVRIQMDSAGTLSTKVVTTDQAYSTEAEAILNCPAPDNGYFDCGTISIKMIDATFTARTTHLDAADDTNYNGVASGLVAVTSDDPAFTSTQYVYGTMVAEVTRTCNVAGSALVVTCTSAGGTSVTDGILDVDYRVFGLDGEITG